MKLTERQKHVLQASILVLVTAFTIFGAEAYSRITFLENELSSYQRLYEEQEWLARYWEVNCQLLRDKLRESDEPYEDPVEEAYEEPPAEVMEQYMDEFGYDFNYVVRVVGAEARDQPFEGIMAVAQCIRTTAEKRGITPEDVVKIKGRYAAPVSKSCDDNMETVNEACLLVFLYGESAVDDDIEYFCMTTTNSSFHNSLRYVCTIGDHNYYAER